MQSTVMDPFHVVRLAGNALDECRRRVQLATCGHRGRKTDPLYACRRTLQTGADLLTDKQRARLAALFAIDAHAEVEATWTMYQRSWPPTDTPTASQGPHHDGRADHHAEHRRPQSRCRR